MTRCASLVFDVSLRKRRLVPVSRFWGLSLISDLTPVWMRGCSPAMDPVCPVAVVQVGSTLAVRPDAPHDVGYTALLHVDDHGARGAPNVWCVMRFITSAILGSALARRQWTLLGCSGGPRTLALFQMPKEALGNLLTHPPLHLYARSAPSSCRSLDRPARPYCKVILSVRDDMGTYTHRVELRTPWLHPQGRWGNTTSRNRHCCLTASGA
jgi:hypothetical protein